MPTLSIFLAHVSLFDAKICRSKGRGKWATMSHILPYTFCVYLKTTEGKPWTKTRGSDHSRWGYLPPSLTLPPTIFSLKEIACSCIATRVNWKEAWKAQSPGFTEWKTAAKESIRAALVKDLEHLDCPVHTFEQPPLPFLLSPFLCISFSILPLFLCHFFLTSYCFLFSVSFGFSRSRVKLQLSF